MSSPKTDGSRAKQPKKRLSMEVGSPSGASTSRGSPTGSPGAPAVHRGPSNVSAALKITPSTTIDALMYWNECLNRTSCNDPHFSSLDLEAQTYPADFVGSLAEVIKSNTYLTYINLSRHQAGNTGVKQLCLGLRGNSTLKRLNLSHTGIGMVAAQAVCDLLIVNKSLTQLNLAGNHLISEISPRLAEVMKSNRTLLSLDVSDCNFAAAPWRDALRWNSTLQELGAGVTLPSANELTFGTASSGRALTSTIGNSKGSGIKLTLQGVIPGVGPDRFVQPLTNEPNSECQLMLKTNRILATITSFMDENKAIQAFVTHLRKHHPSLLVDCCRRGHQAAVHRLLEFGVDPNESYSTSKMSPRKHDSGPITPLAPLSPASSASPSPTPTAYDSVTTPLQEAVLHGNIHIIKLLISYGANITDEVITSLPSSSSGLTLSRGHTPTSSPLSRSGTLSSSSGGGGASLSRDILEILRHGQSGIIDLSNGTYQLFGRSSIVPRPGITGFKLSNNNLGPNLPPYLMATLLQIGSQLQILKLKGNGLTSIPSQIGDLTGLTTLSLTDNALDTIPASIGQLENLKVLKLRKNPLTLLPEDVVKKGTARVLQYLKEITVPVHPWTRMKLLVVGKENVGKTHLIRRLQKRDYSSNISTDGLEISDVPMAKKVDFCIFDFGGQQVFYPTHMFFLSDRALFTVVFSAIDEESFRTVEYWLKVIRALAAGTSHTPVVLVATHMDDPAAQTTIPDLKDRIKKLRQSYRSIIKDVLYVSNRTGDGHKELKAKLVELALAHKMLTTPVPESYVLMEKLVSKEKQHQRPVLMWHEYRAIAKNAHIYDDTSLRACSQFLHDVGSLIWFNQPDLAELVILDPQWLSDVMATVISFKANWKSGLLQHDSLPIVWKQYPASLHKTLLGILERFEVVFPIRSAEGASIVPTMLPDVQSDVMQAFGALTLPRAEYRRVERTYRFGFMPIGFFSRLVARLFLIPNLFCHDPWLRGVMICSPSAFENAEERLFDRSGKEHATPLEASSPLSELLTKFLTRTAVYRKGNIQLGDTERQLLIQQYATLSALMRGFEQASVTYFESNQASILNITVWRPLNSADIFHDNLMTYIVDTVEELLASNYKKYDDSIERIMVHTAASNPSQTTEFPLPDLIRRISSGERTVKCRDELVDIEDIAPDICFTDVQRFNDVVIEKELGEGGVGLVFLATIPSSDIAEADQLLDSLSNMTPSSSTGMLASGSHPSLRTPLPTHIPVSFFNGSDLANSGELALSTSDPALAGSDDSTTLSHSNSSVNAPPATAAAIGAMEVITEESETDAIGGSTPSSSASLKLSAPITITRQSAGKLDITGIANLPRATTPPRGSGSPRIVPPLSTSPLLEPPASPLTPSTSKPGRSSLSSSQTSDPPSPRKKDSTDGSSSTAGGWTSANPSATGQVNTLSTSGSGLGSPVKTVSPSTPVLRRTAHRDKRGIISVDFTSSLEELPTLEAAKAQGLTPDDQSRRRSVDYQRSSAPASPSGVTPTSFSGTETPNNELSKSSESPSYTGFAARTATAYNQHKIRFGSGDGKQGRTQVALKRFKVSAGMEVQRFREFAHEVRLMASLNHPCVVRLYGVQLSPIGMIMEYIAGKDLCTILHNPDISDDVFNWRIRAKIALDIARGMRHLCTQNPPIVHRDLRSPNIFVTGLDENLVVNAKVADFGLSMRVLSNFSDVLQTWQWLAPEVIDMTHCNYDETSDVYSFGIVLWEIATRKFPFSEFSAYIMKDTFELNEQQRNDPALIASLKGDGWEFSEDGVTAIRETYNRQKFVDLILKENLRPTIPSGVPPAFARLIEHCWAREPGKRPSWNAIVHALSRMLGDKARRWMQTVRASQLGSSTGSLSGRAHSPSGTSESIGTVDSVMAHGVSASEPHLNAPIPLPGSIHKTGSSSPGLIPQPDRKPSPAPMTPPSSKLPSANTPLSTLNFLQQIQDDGHTSTNQDEETGDSFANLVSIPADSILSVDSTNGNSSSEHISPRSPDSTISPRSLATSGRTSRNSMFVHSANLNVTSSMPTSTKAPVILTRTIEQTLSQSALVMVQAEENKVWIGQQDGRVSIFETSSPPKFVTSFAAHKKDIFAMAVVGQDMWIGSADATISVWSIKKLKQRKILKDHAKVVRAILSIPKLGKNNPQGYVISGDTDGTLIIWKNQAVAHQLRVATNQPINSLIYVEESKHLWVGTYRKIFVYSVQDWSLVTELQAHEGMINSMVQYGDMLWTCCSNTNTLACWDTKTLDNRINIKGTPRITCLTLVTHPFDNTTLLWGGSLEKVIYIYDCKTGELIESLKGHTDYVYTMLKLQQEQSVWTSGRDCTVRTWNF